MTNAESLAIKGQIATLEAVIKNLKSLLNEEKESHKENKEFKIISTMTQEEITQLANQIVLKTGLTYEGTCTAVSVSYELCENEGFEVPFLNRNKLVVTLLDKDNNILRSGTYNKAKFHEYYPQLAYLGVFQYKKDHTCNVVTLPC